MDVQYRGLSSQTALVLTHKGSRFYLNTKRRFNDAREQANYLACNSLQAHVTRLHKDADIKGNSSHSGRRRFADGILRQTGDIETVQQLLGHAELDHCLPYMSIDPKKPRERFASVI
jgi:site-specific recombinase XerD